ncbi:uncharacterized protein [Antedon mediterranea]|uniref:uncharacterized protein n=1 Tax=Antedon mediterranea TaxID=105859 RepID=UPI003AF4A857
MSAEKQIEANASAHNGFQTSSDYNPSITVTVERSPYRTKSLLDAYILLIPLGFFGAHHFYLRRPGWGVLYLFTFGLLGLGWLLDIFRMPNLVQNANNKDIYGETSTQKFDLLDTWVIGFCPITGLLGFHHYRLGRIGWGLLYTFTLGLFGLGWLFDNFRMPLLVKRANIEALENNPSEGKYKDQCERQEPFKGYYLDDVYVLAFNPLGILGLHHFYLKRCGWGTLYLLTVGVFGIGWLVDLVRMKRLVERKNSEICHHNQGAYYHHSSTPHYGATNLPQSQYHSENTGFQPEYQPGPHDYQPGVPNH